MLMSYDDVVKYVYSVVNVEGYNPSTYLVETMLQQAIAYMYGESSIYIVTTNVSLSAGVSTISISGDVLSLYRCYVGEQEIQILSTYDGIAKSLDYYNMRGMPIYAYCMGNIITVIPTPDSNYNCVISYSSIPSIVDKDALLSYIPSQYRLLPAYYVLSILPEQQLTNDVDVYKNNSRQLLYRRLWEEGLDKLQSYKYETRNLKPFKF